MISAPTSCVGRHRSRANNTLSGFAAPRGLNAAFQRAARRTSRHPCGGLSAPSKAASKARRPPPDLRPRPRPLPQSALRPVGLCPAHTWPEPSRPTRPDVPFANLGIWDSSSYSLLSICSVRPLPEPGLVSQCPPVAARQRPARRPRPRTPGRVSHISPHGPPHGLPPPSLHPSKPSNQVYIPFSLTRTLVLHSTRTPLYPEAVGHVPGVNRDSDLRS